MPTSATSSRSRVALDDLVGDAGSVRRIASASRRSFRMPPPCSQRGGRRRDRDVRHRHAPFRPRWTGLKGFRAARDSSCRGGWMREPAVVSLIRLTGNPPTVWQPTEGGPVRKLRTRISPATALAALALFVALAGTGAAAVVLPGNSVGTAQLRNGAVTAAKVKRHSLLASNFKPGQLPAGLRDRPARQDRRGRPDRRGPQALPAAELRRCGRSSTPAEASPARAEPRRRGIWEQATMSSSSTRTSRSAPTSPQSDCPPREHRGRSSQASGAGWAIRTASKSRPSTPPALPSTNRSISPCSAESPNETGRAPRCTFRPPFRSPEL